MKILIIEDDAGYLKMLTMHLEHRGDSITTASNGEEGLETFLNNPTNFDVILTDNKMPKMSGTELITNLRENGFTVPIVILTGIENLDREKQIANNVFQILFKPIKLGELDAVFTSIQTGLDNKTK